MDKIIASLEEIASELYSYAADEYNLARATGDHSDERWLNAYNSVIDTINLIEKGIK
jgi:hypothetical protein